MLHKVQNWGSISQIESALIECFGRFPLFQAQFVRDSRLQLAPALLLLSLSLSPSLSLSLCLVLSFSPYAIQLLQIAPSQLTTSHDDDDNDDGALFSPCIQNTFNSRRSADQAFPHTHTLSHSLSLSLSRCALEQGKWFFENENIGVISALILFLILGLVMGYGQCTHD